MVNLSIFQTWKTKDESTWPYVYKKCQESWQRLHPDTPYKLYDDIDNENIIHEYFPGKLERVFNSVKNPVEEADIIRYVISYLYGGLYADMDFMALKSHEPLYESVLNSDYGIVFGSMDVRDVENESFIANNIPNAWTMTVYPNEVFWLLVLDEICYRMDYTYLSIESRTGPDVLKQCIEKYAKMTSIEDVVASFRHMNIYIDDMRILRMANIRILEPVLLYANSWTNRPEFFENQTFFLENEWNDICLKFPDSIAFTFWAHNW